MNLAVVGAQWGDEGKGKIVDRLAGRFRYVVRYQGGPNAGHTVSFGGETYALHHVPSGIFHDGVRCLVGAGCVVDPDRLIAEIDALEARGVPVGKRLRLSARAHLILPWHRALDEAMERARGDAAIGTTGRGIGPAYAAKAERWGARLADLNRPEALAERARAAEAAGVGARLGTPAADVDAMLASAEAWRTRLAPLVGDVTRELHAATERGEPILFEGAQGALLDVDFGTYPFVTSSTTIAGGIPASLGLPARAVQRVLGVFKAYATRVGAGPFPTEETGRIGRALRERGREFGTTTGRPRRCGWFDGVAARYAARLNGVDALAITKFDVLDGVDPVALAVAYTIDGDRTDAFPADASTLARAEPVYETLPGWSGSTRSARTLDDLPANARRLLDRIAELAGAPVACVSVGPGRDETIEVETVAP